MSQSGATLRWSRYGGTGVLRLRGPPQHDPELHAVREHAPGHAQRHRRHDVRRHVGGTGHALLLQGDGRQPGLERDPRRAAGTVRPVADDRAGSGHDDPQSARPGRARTCRTSRRSTSALIPYGLVRFDFSDIPANSDIASATVSLWRNGSTCPGGDLIDAAPVGREWRESTTADCVGDGATWTHAYDGVPWTQPGGDRQDGGVQVDDPAATPHRAGRTSTSRRSSRTGSRAARQQRPAVREGGRRLRRSSRPTTTRTRRRCGRSSRSSTRTRRRSGSRPRR